MTNGTTPLRRFAVQLGLAASAGFGLCGGCASHPQADDVRRPSGSASTQAAVVPLWPRFDSALLWSEVGTPFQSEHLEPMRQAVVRVSPEAAEPYQQWVLGVTLAPGSALLEQLSYEPGGTPERYLAMEKVGSSWLYLRLDLQGRVLDTDAALCQRCHAEAVSDEVFGAQHAAAPVQSAPPLSTRAE